MNDVAAGVVLVIRLDTSAGARAVAEAGIRAGFDAVEVTFSVPDAARVISDIVPVAARHGTPIGAGTVLEPAQVDAAADAGATFVVAPDTFAPVAERARARGLAYVPGAFTPTEIQTAHRLGASAVKVFPIRSGGPDYISELRGPLPHITYVVSGGLGAEDCAQLLRQGAHAACVGAGLFSAQAREAADIDTLVAEGRAFLAVARGTARFAS